MSFYAASGSDGAWNRRGDPMQLVMPDDGADDGADGNETQLSSDEADDHSRAHERSESTRHRTFDAKTDGDSQERRRASQSRRTTATVANRSRPSRSAAAAASSSSSESPSSPRLYAAHLSSDSDRDDFPPTQLSQHSAVIDSSARSRAAVWSAHFDQWGGAQPMSPQAFPVYPAEEVSPPASPILGAEPPDSGSPGTGRERPETQAPASRGGPQLPDVPAVSRAPPPPPPPLQSRRCDRCEEARSLLEDCAGCDRLVCAECIDPSATAALMCVDCADRRRRERAASARRRSRDAFSQLDEPWMERAPQLPSRWLADRIDTPDAAVPACVGCTTRSALTVNASCGHCTWCVRCASGLPTRAGVPCPLCGRTVSRVIVLMNLSPRFWK